MFPKTFEQVQSYLKDDTFSVLDMILLEYKKGHKVIMC